MALRKPAGTWTYDDLLTLPDDGRRYEIIEGELYEMPAPTSAHALTIANIISLLIPLLMQLGGRWLTAPLDVFFAGANPVQPDIIVLLPDGQAQIVTRGIEGAPDLLVEVLSPSNRGHDLLTKRALYARAGVREHWIVDPEAKTLEILTLDRDALHSVAIATGADVPTSPLFGSLGISVETLFPTIEQA
jgi:Uma2 family endonuclease